MRPASLAFALIISLLICSGCRKSASNTVATAETAPAIIDDAFKTADPKVQAEAASAAQATRQSDPTAVVALTELMRQPDLTGQQRAAIGRVLPVALTAAQAAAANGDTRANEILKAYKATR